MSFDCNTCNKKYKSYQSLWNHNKKFHSKSNLDVIQETTNSNPNESTANTSQKFICKYCNNPYSNRQNKWKHEQKCRIKTEEKMKITKQENDKQAELKQKLVELEIKKQEAKILKLKIKLQKSKQIDIITLKRLNKLLLKQKESNTNIKNYSNNTNCNNTINIVNNNFFQIQDFGKEKDVQNTLTFQEKYEVLTANRNSLEKLIEIMYCRRYNKYKNVIVTNKKDDYLYLFVSNSGIFIVANKKTIINQLIENRKNDLEMICNENIVPKTTIKIIKNLIDNISAQYRNPDETNFDSEIKYIKKRIINMLFNNQEQMKSDLYQEISKNYDDNTKNHIVEIHNSEDDDNISEDDISEGDIYIDV